MTQNGTSKTLNVQITTLQQRVHAQDSVARQNVASCGHVKITKLGLDASRGSRNLSLTSTGICIVTKTTRKTCFAAPVSKKKVLNASGTLEDRWRLIDNMNGALRSDRGHGGVEGLLLCLHTFAVRQVWG